MRAVNVTLAWTSVGIVVVAAGLALYGALHR